MFAFLTTAVNFEGVTAFGFNADSVFSGMMSVIAANIAPILALMGLMLGAGWVVKYFRRARKGSI